MRRLHATSYDEYKAHAGKSVQVCSHQLRKHGEQQRRREDGGDEYALLVEVGLPRKALPVLLQVAVDAPRIVHQGSCTTQASQLSCSSTHA